MGKKLLGTKSSSMKLKDLILKPSKWFLGLDKKLKIIFVILLLIITIQTFPEESSTDIVENKKLLLRLNCLRHMLTKLKIINL